MKKFFKKLNDFTISCHDELENLNYLLKSVGINGAHKVLDVGCGYGRVLDFLTKHYYDVAGVDKNKHIVQINKKACRNCQDLDEFKEDKKIYDVIIMFHVIEHFSPGELLEFMDFYLDRLKTRGYLIIATPLMTKYFYDDFDHIKPYNPVGIEMVFNASCAQVQYYSRNKLKLENIKYKKYYYRLTDLKGLYIKTINKYFILFIHFLSALAFKLSLGILGKKDGWMGLYKKIS